MFVMLGALVRCVCANDSGVQTPGRNLELNVPIVVGDNCCNVWSEMGGYNDSYSGTFRLGRTKVECVLVDTICGRFFEVCFGEDEDM